MEPQGNSNQEGTTNDPMIRLMMIMARTASTQVFNDMSTNFDWITSRIGQGGQLMWTIILQACYLLLEVSRQMSMSMMNIIFDGGENRIHLLKESLKEARKKILNIGQAVHHIFMNYWVNQETPDLNMNLQNVLETNLNLEETAEQDEDHSHQSSSDQGRTPNEESDISLDTKISF